MNLKHARYILTVLQEGSVTAAAKRLYVSQPSISQTIRTVEKELGMPIFERGQTGLTLSYAGRRYINVVQKMLQLSDNLIKEMDDLKGEAQGKLSLGISSQRGMNLLPKVLPDFFKAFPLVQVEIEEEGSGRLERMLLEGTLDIAFLTTSAKENELKYTLIEEEQMVLMASCETQFAKKHKNGELIDIKEAKDEFFVALKPGHSVRLIQDQMFEKYSIKPRILVELDNFESAKHLAARSGGVMLTPYVYIANVPTLKRLVKCFPVKNLETKRDFYLCHRKDIYFTRYMEKLVQLVKMYVKSYRVEE